MNRRSFFDSLNNIIGSTVHFFVFLCLIFLSTYGVAKNFIKSILSDVILFFAPYVSSFLKFLRHIEHFFHARSFKYVDEILTLSVSKTSDKVASMSVKLEQNNDVSDGSLLLSKLIVRAGFYPYNVCVKKPGESLANYKKRVCSYRVEKIAEELIKDKDVVEKFCVIRPLFRKRALLLADSLNDNYVVRIASGILLDQKKFNKFIDILCNKNAINALADAIVELDEARKEYQKLREDNSTRMKEAMVNLMLLSLHRLENLLPAGIECIEGINELVLDCIYYKDHDGNIVPMRKEQWYSLLHTIKSMCTELIHAIRSFRDNFDDGRIYGDWLIKMTNVVNTTTSILENFSQYLPASSFINIDGSIKMILSGLNIDSKDVFSELDTILPKNLDGDSIQLNCEGGIIRMMKMVFGVIKRELPMIVEYLGRSLNDEYKKYIAIYGEQQDDSIFDLKMDVDISDILVNKECICNSITNIIHWMRVSEELFEQSHEALQNTMSGRAVSYNGIAVAKAVALYFLPNTSSMLQLLRNFSVFTHISVENLRVHMKKLYDIFYDLKSCNDDDALSSAVVNTAQDSFCTVVKDIRNFVSDIFLSEYDDFLQKVSDCDALEEKFRNIRKEIMLELSLLEKYLGSLLPKTNVAQLENCVKEVDCPELMVGA